MNKKGIIVYPSGGSLGVAKPFFEKLCQGSLIIYASERIDVSYITISEMLEDSNEPVAPNVFVISESEDRFFNWEDYISKPCFSSLGVKVNNVVLSPTIEEYILEAYGSKMSFIINLFNLRNDSSRTPSKQKVEACVEELIGEIPFKKLLRNRNEFRSLANLLLGCVDSKFLVRFLRRFFANRGSDDDAHLESALGVTDEEWRKHRPKRLPKIYCRHTLG